MKREENEILVTGYAKLPQGITATELYSTIGVSILVNRSTGEILDLECTLATAVAKNFVRKNVIGKHLDCMEEVSEVIENCYYGSAKKAILSAIYLCHEKFLQIR